MSTTVRIVQLYPQSLGITGDRGNVRALQTRLERSGVPTVVSSVGVGDEIPSDVDVVVSGNGPLSAMRGVVDDFRARTAQLTEFVADGGSLLAVGGSAELLASHVELLDGTTLSGLGLLPYRVTRTRDRKVGYIVAESPLGRVIGFEDHASEWHPDSDDVAFGTVVDGRGSFDRAGGRGEIVRHGAAYATNIQGPVLPLNPEWADDILRAATARRGISWSPGDANRTLDEYAAGARAAIEQTLHGRNFNAMGV